MLNMKHSTAKLYIFHQKWQVFIFQAYGEKKILKNPDPNFWHFMVGRGGQANIFFWPNVPTITLLDPSFPAAM